MHWSDDAAKELERITGDPLADAAPGTLSIANATATAAKVNLPFI